MSDHNGAYVPEGISNSAPLLIVLHGGGRDGASQIELWKTLADKEKVILLAPTSRNQWWSAKEDREEIANRANHAMSTLPVDRRRIYLFGHSLGGSIAFQEGFGNRSAIASVSLHSPTPFSGMYQFPQEPGTRRLPLGVWVGEESCDSNWHCASTLRYAYQEHPNLAVDLRVLSKHAHNDIYTRPGLTQEIWEFLSQHSI